MNKNIVLLALTATTLAACVPSVGSPRPTQPPAPVLETAPGTPAGIAKVCPPENTLTITPVTTAPDSEPNQFCFNPVLNANPDPSQAISSGSFTVRGINQPAPLTASNGTTVYLNDQFLEYFSPQSTPKMVNAGDRIRVAGSASNKLNDSSAYTLTIGGVSDTFYIVTRAK
jgi:hypothetical protein